MYGDLDMRYSVVNRVFKVLESLQSRRQTFGELKQEFSDICDRTLERDLKFLTDNMYVFIEQTDLGQRYRVNTPKKF